MTTKLPPAPEQYDRNQLQQVINALQDLLEAQAAPKGTITFVDADTSKLQLLRIASGATEVIDP